MTGQVFDRVDVLDKFRQVRSYLDQKVPAANSIIALDILMTLFGHDELPIRDLPFHIRKSDRTCRDIVSRLEREGLAIVSRDTPDSRAARVRLTPLGDTQLAGLLSFVCGVFMG
jgi:DNA-binding MarR family transcriptional regulator